MGKESESKFQSFMAARTGAAEPLALGSSDIPTSRQHPEGRPAGKRSDPAYEQVTAYIRKRTHDAVKMALLEEGKRRQFSELVEELLANWALQGR
jgi:hypothetical protein